MRDARDSRSTDRPRQRHRHLARHGARVTPAFAARATFSRRRRTDWIVGRDAGYPARMKKRFAPALLIAAILLAALGLLSGCATIFQRGPTPPLLLISLDAFRWDYCALHPEQTPHLRQLMREGISARQFIPVFPS